MSYANGPMLAAAGGTDGTDHSLCLTTTSPIHYSISLAVLTDFSLSVSASFSRREIPMATKYVYIFANGKADGRGDMKDLLGGKGAGLAEMTNAALPVPPGFTITTAACNAYFKAGKKLPPGLWDQVERGLATVEKTTKKKLGDPKDPLLVSVRSGAAMSMPGMMDTVLNLGLNDQSRKGLAKLTKNERFAWDAYRRFISMFGRIVLDIPAEKFDHALEAKKKAARVQTDPELSPTQLEELVDEFKAIVRTQTGKPFPTEPKEQLRLAIEAVFGSWFGQRAKDYRKQFKISDDLGTACSIVTMVYGNRGDGALRRVPDERAGRGRRRRHPHAFEDRADEEGSAQGVRRIREDREAAREALPRCA